MMAVFSVALALAPSQAVALAMAVGAGLGASAAYGLISSYGQNFPEWQSGVVVSLFILSGAVGSVVLPYVLGPLASAAGFRVALALVAVPAVACALFGQLIHKRAETSALEAARTLSMRVFSLARLVKSLQQEERRN